MAKRNSINLSATTNADGFNIAGGTTERILTVTGGDVTITGSGSAVITFPSSTSTLATLALTETLSNKSFSSAPLPSTDDGVALGSTSFKFSDLFLAEGGVINWDSGDLTITQTGNELIFGGLTSIRPSVNDGAAVGTSSASWADLFLASGALINVDNGNAIITHSSGIFTVSTGDLRVTTAGTNTASAVTVGGTQTLTNKTLTASGLITANAGITAAITTVGITASVTGANATDVLTITVDTSTASNQGLIVQNATNFAHSGNLVEMSFLNATDSGILLKLAQAGSGAALDITQKDSTTAVSILINATQANVTTSDTFIAFKSTSGTEGSIAGTGVGGVLAYNTFTGSHWTRVCDENVEVLDLLEIIDGDGDINGKDHLFETRVCSTRGSKAAVGVYGGRNLDGLDLVLSIGTGYVMAANKGEDIEIGDYFIASDVRGCVEKQVDDIYRSNTVAKATESVRWAGERKMKVSCIYVGG